jgi:hypothetical protein
VGGTLTITTANTIGILISYSKPSLPGQPVVFTFTVNAVAPGQGTSPGTAQFEIDGTNADAALSLSRGSANLTTSSGVFQLTDTSSLPQGPYRSVDP